jgi:hypothetical protein
METSPATVNVKFHCDNKAVRTVVENAAGRGFTANMIHRYKIFDDSLTPKPVGNCYHDTKYSLKNVFVLSQQSCSHVVSSSRDAEESTLQFKEYIRIDVTS